MQKNNVSATNKEAAILQENFKNDTHWLTSWAYFPLPFKTLWWSSSKVISPEWRRIKINISFNDHLDISFTVLTTIGVTISSFWFNIQYWVQFIVSRWLNFNENSCLWWSEYKLGYLFIWEMAEEDYVLVWVMDEEVCLGLWEMDKEDYVLVNEKWMTISCQFVIELILICIFRYPAVVNHIKMWL